MDTTRAQFRTARREDIDAVVELIQEVGLPSDGVRSMFDDDASRFLVAVDDVDIVAVAGLEVCCRNALLRSVAVRDDWRRHGLGTKLVARAVCEAQARGIDALYLLTMTAEHYFPRFGFEVVNRNAVPAEIAQTLEFTSACPATATVMAMAVAHPSYTS